PHVTRRAVNPEGKSIAALKLQLSDDIKADRLFAFVEIPADILDITVTSSQPIGYDTETPSYGALPDWIESTLDKEVAARRFTKASVDPAMVAKLTRNTSVSKMGLVESNGARSLR